MVDLIELSGAGYLLHIAPALGGGIADAVAVTAGREIPLLRRWAGPEAGPFGLGCNVLVPFSGRISGGGFVFDDRFHALEPNIEGELYPIHGDGLLASWKIAEQMPDRLTLTHAGRIGPYRYDATLSYVLENAAVSCHLDIVNRGPRMPFGGGFHPWFPRRHDTTLCFAARGVWTETPDHLPLEHLEIELRPDWNFRRPSQLPRTWINAAFTGWDCIAEIEQPSAGLRLLVEASSNLDCAIVYSPSPDAEFFCFEPVSHAVDAHNRTDQPGLIVLEEGGSLAMWMRLTSLPLQQRLQRNG